ncbi:MAG: ATP-binding protein [Actinomycetota bacterium]|nr:ATP-binding protein [Actinomycetota bacterium]
MLARRLPGIMPPMSDEEMLEVTRIYSVAGLLTEKAHLISARPFRSPHHNVTMAGLVGGGAGLPRPGEVSLAHLGLLFLDELCLYHSDALEALRGPIEDGTVRIARSGGAVTYPCRFSFVAAMNPCPCGYAGDNGSICRCTTFQLKSYRTKLSGPLIDRIDMQALMARVTKDDLMGPADGESSAVIRRRVETARRIQAERYGTPRITNATAKIDVRKAALTKSARALLGDAVTTRSLTGRGFARVLRVARTAADLEATEEIDDGHIAAALRFRLDLTASQDAA